MKRKTNESGAMAIEALIGITVFLFAMMAFYSMTLIGKVQADMQYALGQTAKEISGYYYLIDKMGLAAITAGGTKPTDIDQTISDVIDFSDTSVNLLNNAATTDFNSIDLDTINSIKEDGEKSFEAFKAIVDDLEKISEDPKEQLKQVLSVFGKTCINSTVSLGVGPYICKAIMPKYLGGDKKSADEYMEKVGISSGLKARNFYGTQLLTDKRSIKLVVTYTLDYKKLTFGVVKNGSITLRQTASTAAWVKSDGANIGSLEEIGNEYAEYLKKLAEGEESEA